MMRLRSTLTALHNIVWDNHQSLIINYQLSIVNCQFLWQRQNSPTGLHNITRGNHPISANLFVLVTQKFRCYNTS